MISTNKLKIMFLITGLQTGGAERVMANLANGFVKCGHQVRIVVMKKAITDYKLVQEVEFVGADAVGRKGKNNIFKGVKFYIKNIKSFSPDIVISFLGKTNVIATFCRLFLIKGIPVVVCERADPNARKGLFGRLNDLLFPCADGCAFQTVAAKDYYKIKDTSKIEILKNPLSDEFNVKPYMGVRKKEIITAGRLSDQKNHALLIDAFSKIVHKYSDYKLIIYGDGPLKDALYAHINKLGLRERVILPGRVDNIKDKIYESSLFVLSSDFEGMPNALLEAMSLGLPCISTDCPVGGPREIIDNYQNGIIVHVNDSDEMARAIDEVLSNNELAEKLSFNANKIYQNFSMENVIKEWEQFVLRVYEKFIC